MAADTELLAMQYVYSLKDDMTRPLKNIGDRWERFKKRIVSAEKASSTSVGVTENTIKKWGDAFKQFAKKEQADEVAGRLNVLIRNMEKIGKEQGETAMIRTGRRWIDALMPKASSAEKSGFLEKVLSAKDMRRKEVEYKLFVRKAMRITDSWVAQLGSIAGMLAFGDAIDDMADLQNTMAGVAASAKGVEGGAAGIKALTDQAVNLGAKLKVDSALIGEFFGAYAKSGIAADQLDTLTSSGVKYAKVFGMGNAEAAEFIANQVRINRLSPEGINRIGSAMLNVAKATGESTTELMGFLGQAQDYVKRFRAGDLRESVQKQLLAVRGLFGQIGVGESDILDMLQKVGDAADVDGHKLLGIYAPLGGMSARAAREAINSGKGIDKAMTALVKGMARKAKGMNAGMIDNYARMTGSSADMLRTLRNASEAEIDKIAKSMTEANGKTDTLDTTYDSFRGTVSDLKDQLKALWKNVIGNFVLPVLSPLIAGLKLALKVTEPFFAIVSKIPGPVKAAAVALVMLSGALSGVGIASTITDKLSGFLGIAKKIPAVGKVLDKLSGISPGGFLGSILGKGKGGKVLGLFQSALSPILKFLPKIGLKLGLRLLGGIGIAFLAFDLVKLFNKYVLRPLIEKLGGKEALAAWDKFLGKLAAPFKALWSSLKSGWVLFKDNVLQGLQEAWGPVREGFKEVMDALKPLIPAFKDLWSAIVDIFQEIGLFKSKGEGAKVFFEYVGAAVGLLVKVLGKGLVLQLKYVAFSLKIVVKVFQAVIKVITWLIKAEKSVIRFWKTLFTSPVRALTGLSKGVKGWVGQFLSGLQGIAQKIAAFVQDTFIKPIQAIGNRILEFLGLDKVLKALGAVAQFAGGILGRFLGGKAAPQAAPQAVPVGKALVAGKEKKPYATTLDVSQQLLMETREQNKHLKSILVANEKNNDLVEADTKDKKAPASAARRNSGYSRTMPAYAPQDLSSVQS